MWVFKIFDIQIMLILDRTRTKAVHNNVSQSYNIRSNIVINLHLCYDGFYTKLCIRSDYKKTRKSFLSDKKLSFLTFNDL